MSFKIPLFELNFDEQEEKTVIETLRSRWISTGPRCQEFEDLFCKYLKVNHALTTNSCTSALHLAMVILNIGIGDEVIVPSLTFVATVNTLRYTGATPVFADISSYENLNISPKEIEEKITPKTKAIIVMHYGGFPCEMDKIMEIAERYNLKVIEDACHGPLSEYNGKKLGTFGDIGCFSFFSNKNMSTGEGGMMITDYEEYYNKAQLLRSHGMTTLSYERAKGHSTSYDVVELGYNYRMDDIRASIGIVQLQKLKADLVKRIDVRKMYVEQLSKIDGIIIPFEDNKEFCSNYIFPIILKNSNCKKRDEVRNKLHEKGIQTSIHYPVVHRFFIYNSFNSNLPISEYVADNEITLPMYSKLTIDNIHYIASSLETIL